jgi:PAS domain-containing protein
LLRFVGSHLVVNGTQLKRRTSLINFAQYPPTLGSSVKNCAAAEAATVVAQGIIDAIREPVLVLDQSLRVAAVSRAFCTTFNLDIDDILGQPLYELGDGEWNIPQLRLLLGRIIPDQVALENYEVEHDFHSLGRRRMLLNARDYCGTVLELERQKYRFQAIVRSYSSPKAARIPVMASIDGINGGFLPHCMCRRCSSPPCWPLKDARKQRAEHDDADLTGAATVSAISIHSSL